MKKKIMFEFELFFYIDENEILKFSNYNENAFFDFIDSLKKLNYSYILGIIWFVFFFILLAFLLNHCYKVRRKTTKREISHIIDSSKFDLTDTKTN